MRTVRITGRTVETGSSVDGNPRPPAAGRLSYLDSLRGVAALVVLLHHSLLTFPGFDEVRAHGLRAGSWARIAALPPFSLAWDGPVAVLIFFALSGFVLALMLSGRPMSWGAFAIRRFCRIYLPYAGAVAIAMWLMSLFGATEVAGTSDWFRSSWSEPLSTNLLLHHLFMLGGHNTVDSPIWSLVHEFRVSMVFPALMVVVRRFRARTILPLLMAVVVLRDTPFVAGLQPSRWTSAIDTAGYVFLFAAGAYLACNWTRVRTAVQSMSAAGKTGFAMATLAGISLPSMAGSVHFWWARATCDVAGQLGALGILVLVVSLPGPERVLSRPVLLWFGAVSYSLYLTHVIVLLTAVHALGNMLPLVAIILGVPVAAIAVAAVSYRCLEVPAIHIGRSLSVRFDEVRGRRKPGAAVVTPAESTGPAR